MNGNIEQQELRERLNLIESMIAEGRRKHESWGWTFLLWGVAYYVAIVWASWSHFAYAWPITMVAAAIDSITVFIHRGKNIPNTTMGRAIGSIWTAMGISMFILFDALGFAGRLDTHTSVAAACALLGMTNAASSLALKWKTQFACALVWWIACIVASFGTETQCAAAFLVAIFLCQIVFGTYMMVLESRQRRQVAAHA